MSPEFQARLSELHDTFNLLDDWELRLQHVIDLGKDLPALKPEERTDETRVLGCASKVWLVIDRAGGRSPAFSRRIRRLYRAGADRHPDGPAERPAFQRCPRV
ncbi:MAG: SufE family protein [Asticcacaulis sp.]